MDGRSTDVKDIAPTVKFLCTEDQWVMDQTIFAMEVILVVEDHFPDAHLDC